MRTQADVVPSADPARTADPPVSGPLASVGHQDSNEITASEGADQRADNEHQRHRPSVVGYFSGHHCPGFVQR